jgi:hypothetical protein
MRAIITSLAILLAVAGCNNKAGSRPEEGQSFVVFHYANDFESEQAPMFAPWTKNGEVRVNEIGIKERSGGGKCFHLDVTLVGATYCYYSLPVEVPCEGDLVLTGALRIDSGSDGSATLGVNYIFPPGTNSGVQTHPRPDQRDAWVPLRLEDLVSHAHELARGYFRGAGIPGQDADTGGKVVDRVGLMLYGKAGQRIVVEVDDLVLHGTVPDPTAYTTLWQSRVMLQSGRVKLQAEGWRQDLDRIVAHIPTAAGDAELLAALRAETTALDAAIAVWQKTGNGPADTESRLRFLVRSHEWFQADLARSEQLSPRGMRVRVVDPTSPDLILPETKLIRGHGAVLHLAMCPNERESASFVVTAPVRVNITDLKIAVSDLSCGGCVLPASVLDIKLLICWYQTVWDRFGGVSVREQRTHLVPELLLHDPGLVVVDDQAKTNHLRLGTDLVSHTAKTFHSPLGMSKDFANFSLKEFAIQDTPELRPATVPAGRNQQFLVTCHLPPGTAAGTYRGRLNLMGGGVDTDTLPVEIQVHGFNLVRPANFDASVYYRGRLDPQGFGSIGSELKSERQFLAEMRNMLAHGLENPTVSQKCDTDEEQRLLERTLALRAQAGMSNEVIYYLGMSTGEAGTPEADDRIFAKAVRTQTWFAAHGCKQLYIYGRDEAVGKELMRQQSVWERLASAGIRTYVAGSPGHMKPMAASLSTAVLLFGKGRGPDWAEIDAFHANGHRVLSYADPQIGVEAPYPYRKNYGFLIAFYGLDGFMDYAYQHAFGSVWDDTDHPTYRDHVFAYPTVDGVIDTIQLVGHREGFDDLRYLATLDAAIATAESKGITGHAVDAAKTARKAVLATVGEAGNGDTDLSGSFGSRHIVNLPSLREVIVEAIERLRSTAQLHGPRVN